MRVLASRIFLGMAVVAMGLAAAGQAQAATITFDSLEVATGGIIDVPSPYIESGFQITGTPLNTLSQDDSHYAGSAGLLVAASTGQATLEAVGGTPFNLLSIDLSFVEPFGVSDLVTFTGTLAGGGTVMQSFQPTMFGFQQFDFGPSFTNLTSVSWLQGQGGSFNGHQFDDIVLQTVPEPATLLLMGTGIAAAASRRRQQRRA